MANEDQGRDGILPDFAALCNGGEEFAFPLPHDGLDFGIEDTGSFSLMPLQVPPSPVESIHGDPVNHVSHPPVENLRGISSSLDQISKPSMSSVLDPSLPGDMFSAQNDQIVSLSALNGRQSNGMNSTSRLNEVHPKPNVELLTGFRNAIENIHGTGGREKVNDAGLLLDINSNPFDDDFKPCCANHGVSTSAPQHDGSTFDGRFLSLGHEDSASSGWGSFAFPGDSSVNRFSSNSEKHVPSGTAGCLTLSRDDYGNLPALTSGFDVKPTLISSKPQAGVHQFMATENSRSMEMGNDKNSGYTDVGPRAFHTTPSVSSNGQFGSSEPRRDWRAGFPYDVKPTPSVTSGFDVKPTLISSKPQAGVHQFMETENSRSMEMGNDKNSGYTDIGPGAFQTSPSVSSNGQFGSSEHRHDWRAGFPYDVKPTPSVTSGFDVKPTLISSKPQAVVHEFMETENSRSMEMGNDKNSGYTDIGPRAFQTSPSVSSNGQFGSSEPRCDWRAGFPYDFVSSRSSQQPLAEEQKGLNLRSNISSFQSSTSVTAGKDQLDQASQRLRHVLPLESGFPPPVGAEQGVSLGRSNLTLNSNSRCNPSLKRSSSSFSNVAPRKIMRQHSVAPPNLYVHPPQPQSSMMNLPSVYPQSSMMNLPSVYPQSSMMNLPSVYPQNPAFSNFSHPPHHPFPPPAQFTSPQNTSSVPPFSPFANTSSNNMLARAAAPLAQSAAVRNLNAYPSFSPTITNNIRPLQRSSSLSSPSQIALLQNALGNSSPAFNPLANALPKTEPQPPYHPPFVSKPPISAAVNYGPIFNRAAMGSLPVSTTNVPVLPVATNRIPVPPVTFERNPGYGKAPATGSSAKTATKEGNMSALKNSAVFQRFLQRQSQALAAFEKKSPALGPAASTSSVPHIRWQGSDKPEASGFKCLLCKRDLAYTPEGPISIPDFSPEVAVLPCGHTFHDTCLQAITPQDQSPNPPCIPCSIADPSA